MIVKLDVWMYNCTLLLFQVIGVLVTYFMLIIQLSPALLDGTSSVPNNSTIWWILESLLHIKVPSCGSFLFNFQIPTYPIYLFSYQKLAEIVICYKMYYPAETLLQPLDQVWLGFWSLFWILYISFPCVTSENGHK